MAVMGRGAAQQWRGGDGVYDFVAGGGRAPASQSRAFCPCVHSSHRHPERSRETFANSQIRGAAQRTSTLDEEVNVIWPNMRARPGANRAPAQRRAVRAGLELSPIPRASTTEAMPSRRNAQPQVALAPGILRRRKARRHLRAEEMWACRGDVRYISTASAGQHCNRSCLAA